MSDTPINDDLSKKTSFRAPEFLSDRVQSFKEEYNDQIRSIATSEEEADAYTIDTNSEALRRLIDIGFGSWKEHGIPFGYSFVIEMLHGEDFEPDTLVCPGCDAEDIESFRATADLEADADGVIIEEIGCLECGETFSPEEGAPEPLVSF